jgi:hypothetical protein
MPMARSSRRGLFSTNNDCRTVMTLLLPRAEPDHLKTLLRRIVNIQALLQEPQVIGLCEDSPPQSLPDFGEGGAIAIARPQFRRKLRPQKNDPPKTAGTGHRRSGNRTPPLRRQPSADEMSFLSPTASSIAKESAAIHPHSGHRQDRWGIRRKVNAIPG